MRYGFVPSALAIAFVVTGCSSIPEVAYNRMSAGKIKTIAVPTPSIPSDPSVQRALAPRQKYGMVGTLADTFHANNLKQLALRHNFSVPDAFLSRLTQQLEANGYRVTNVSTPRSGTGFLENYPNSSGVDAYLDVVVTKYGYTAAGSGSNMSYRPQFHAKVRLVRASDAAVLMQDTVIYNANDSFNVITADSDRANTGLKTVAYEPYGSLNDTKSADPNAQAAAHAYPHFSEIVANSAHAVTGLEKAAHQSADTIADMLR
jgi:hypothetical protein